MPKKVAYDLQKIDKLLEKYQHMKRAAKWKKIASDLDASEHAIHRWYYRQQKKVVEQHREKVRDSAIFLNSDFWRWLHGVLILGKTSRHTEEQIRQDFLRVLPEIQIQARGAIPNFGPIPPAPPKALPQGENHNFSIVSEESEEQDDDEKYEAVPIHGDVSITLQIVNEIKKGVKLKKVNDKKMKRPSQLNIGWDAKLNVREKSGKTGDLP